MNKSTKAVPWFPDFLKRVFSSTYEVSAIEVRGDGKIRTFDFRLWPNEKERKSIGTIYKLTWDKFNNVKVNDHIPYLKNWFDGPGRFKDRKGNIFPIPAHLYDFVFWRHVLFTFIFGAILFLTIFSWDGDENIFINDAWTDKTSITNTLYSHLNIGGVGSKRYKAYDVLVFFVLFTIPAFAHIIWYLRKFPRQTVGNGYTIICALTITLIAGSTPTHLRFAEGQVISKSEGIQILNQRLVDIYDSHMEKGEFEKAFALATKRRDDNVDRAQWYVRKLNSAMVIVEKNPLSLDKYVDTLKSTGEFPSLYFNYLQKVSPILAKMHCKDDPWMMYSSDTPVDEKSQIDQICNERAKEMDKAIKKELEQTK